MTADIKRRSFPELAKLLSKEPGWIDEESAFQEILGAFLSGQLSDVTWPRGDVGFRNDGAHVVTIGRDNTGWPIDMRLTVPPQEPVTREEWLVGFHSDAGEDMGRKCKELGLGFETLAKISISEYPSLFRQAYIDWLYTTDAALGHWLKGHGRDVPGWLQDDADPVPLTPEEEPPVERDLSIKTETNCRQWLVGLMRKESRPDKAKSEYAETAKKKFKIGSRAFVRAWAGAIEETGNTDWSRPGRKSKPRIDTPIIS